MRLYALLATIKDHRFRALADCIARHAAACCDAVAASMRRQHFSAAAAHHGCSALAPRPLRAAHKLFGPKIAQQLEAQEQLNELES